MRTPYRVGLLSVLTILVAVTCSEAATRTWRGTGADSLWSNPQNWVLDTVPVDGDDLVFPVTATNPIVTTNDLTNLLVASITINSVRTFNGNAIRLANGITVTAGPVNMNLGIQLTGNQTWSLSDRTFNTNAAGTIDLNGSVLTLDGTAQLLFQGTLTGVISGTGELNKTGLGILILAGANAYVGPTRINQGEFWLDHVSGLGFADGTAANGTTVAAGALLHLEGGVQPPEALSVGGVLSSHDGATTVSAPITVTGTGAQISPAVAGGMVIDSVISGPGNVTMQNGEVRYNQVNTYGGTTSFGGTPANFQVTAALFVNAHEAIPNAPTFDVRISSRLTINQHRQTFAGVTGAVNPSNNFPPPGTIQLNSTANPDDLGTLILNGAGSYVFEGRFQGDGLIHKTGSGRQVFKGNSAGLTGEVVVDNGILAVDGTLPVPVSVSDNGSLELLGATGAITSTQGDLLLEFGTTANAAAGLTLTDGRVTVDGRQGTPGAALAGVTVSGPVSLGNATLLLNLPSDLTASNGDELVIIDKSAPGAVTGTFANLPEGTELVTNVGTVRITYVGGDGNDVLLTVTQAVKTYLLSEGATGPFFSTDILIANPNNTDAATTVQFFTTGGATISQDLTVPALQRKTIRVNEIAGLEGADFSTQVRSISGLPLVVERTMTWDASGYGAHTEHAADTLSTTWYFAEGSQGFFSTYLLLANPQDVANTATVQYLRTDEPPVEKTYALTPRSRRTIDISTEPDLADRSFGMIVTFTQPGMAERAMYFGGPPLFTAGHESAGVTAPSTTWFLPEGATGPFFETFILLANPGAAAVDATVTFLPQDGPPVTVETSVAAKGRRTINIEPTDPSLANAAVATQVTATGPIIAERAQYWPDPAPQWYEAHNSFGVTTPGTRWGLAEGRVGLTRAYQTYILLANPGDPAASVIITFLRDGTTPVTKTFNVPGKSRLNVSTGPGSMVPELTNETFGALIESTQPIAVERAMYSDANGQVWAAGTSATGVRLP